MNFIKLTDQMPDPDQFPRVLIYTEYVDFNGEQFFDVQTDALDEGDYEGPLDQLEICRMATHWSPRPCDIGEI